jgi:hypothetical protein
MAGLWENIGRSKLSFVLDSYKDGMKDVALFVESYFLKIYPFRLKTLENLAGI